VEPKNLLPSSKVTTAQYSNKVESCLNTPCFFQIYFNIINLRNKHYKLYRSWYSAYTTDETNWGLNSGSDKRFFSAPKSAGSLCCSPSPFPGRIAEGAYSSQFITHIHLVRRLRMSRTILVLSSHAVMGTGCRSFLLRMLTSYKAFDSVQITEMNLAFTVTWNYLCH
jgi:hypothetical protein